MPGPPSPQRAAIRAGTALIMCVKPLEQGGPVSMIAALKAVSVLGSRIVVAPKGAVLSDVGSS